MPALPLPLRSPLRRAAACTLGACLAAAGGQAGAVCTASFMEAKVITDVISLNDNACNLSGFVVRETGRLTLYDKSVGVFINGATDLSGNTGVADASFENWGVMTNAALGQFYNLRGFTNRGELQNDGTLENRLYFLNLATVTNRSGGVLTNASAGNFDNYADLNNSQQLRNDGTLDNYARIGNDAGATFVSQGQFNNRSGGTLLNQGTTRLLGVSVLEAGSSLNNTATLDIGGRLLLQGELLNSGVVNVLADGGDGLTLAKGASFDFVNGLLSVAGKLTFEADFTQTNATLNAIEFKPGSTLINRGTYTPNEWVSALHSVTFRNEGTARLVIVGPLVLANDVDQPNAYFVNEANARVEVTPAGTLGFAQPAFNAGVIQNDGTLYISQSVVNQRGAHIFNTGYLDINTTLWNDGALVNNGGTVKVVGPLPFHGLTGQGSYLQTSGTTLVEGDMEQGGVRIEGGRLVVTGTLTTKASDGSTGIVELLGGELSGKDGLINGETFIGGGPGTARFRPGSSPGNFTIHGGLTLLPGGELELEVERGANGLLAFDFVKADHMLLNGTVHFKLGAGVSGASLAELSMLDCGSGCEFGSNFGYVFDGGSAGATASFTAHGLTLSIPAAAVPEPASLALWLAGLLAVGARGGARRRA